MTPQPSALPQPPADPQTPEYAEVAAALAAARLPVSAAEVAALAATHRIFRTAVEALYAVPEARYAEPAVRFRADARVVDWG